MSVRRASQHPTDRLMWDLIAGGRSATADDVREIVERMATAPFNPQVVRVPTLERGAGYLGHTLGRREPSLVYHLTKRVTIEEQWATGTTAEQYMEDLRRAVRHAAARIMIYERRGEHLAATITPTAHILAPERVGPDPLPDLLVVYSADRSIIVTGYQFSSLDRTGIPQEARWLR